MTTTTAVLLGIFLLLGLLFGLACFFLGPAGWLFWVLSMGFLAGCGVLYGLCRLLGYWVLLLPLLLLLPLAVHLTAFGAGVAAGELQQSGGGPLAILFVAVVVAIGLKILCPGREK